MGWSKKDLDKLTSWKGLEPDRSRLETLRMLLEKLHAYLDDEVITSTSAEGHLRIIRSVTEEALDLIEQDLIEIAFR